VKTFKTKYLGKLFGHFWFLKEFLEVVLMIPPKDGFALCHNGSDDPIVPSLKDL